MKIKITTDKPIDIGMGLSIMPTNGLLLTVKPVFDDLGNIYVDTNIQDGDGVNNLTIYFSSLSYMKITDYSGASNPKGSNVVHLLYDWLYSLVVGYCVANLGFAEEDFVFVSY